jgi:hypothetical protein
VVGKHALKNAFAPTLTVIGFQLKHPSVTETIFSLPGIGQPSTPPSASGHSHCSGLHPAHRLRCDHQPDRDLLYSF